MHVRAVVGTVVALVGLSVLAAAVLLTNRNRVGDSSPSVVFSSPTVVVAEAPPTDDEDFGAIGQVPFVDVPDAPEAVSADSRSAALTSPPVEPPFLQGISGVVTSPRVLRSPDASGAPRHGLDPRRAEAYVLPIRFSAALTLYGAPEVRRRPGHDGSFRLPTTPGLKLVVLRQDDVEPGLAEVWSAIVRVAPGETVDLGVDAFSSAVTRGRTVDEAGVPVPKAMVIADDREPDDRSPVVLGTDALTFAGSGGRFAFSFARYTGPRSAFPRGPVLRIGLSAHDADRRAEPMDTPIGGHVELVLKSIAREASEARSRRLSVAVPEGSALYVRSERLVDVHKFDATTVGPDGRYAFDLDLPADDYVFEFVDGDRVAVLTADFRTAGELRLDPAFEIGRVVEGSAEGLVSRVVFAGEPRERALQSIRAEGPFTLSGLPLKGELVLRVADRIVRIQDGSSRVVRID